MQHCKQCNKPLTEFEVLFHQKAKSKPETACKCWSCSGAKDAFGIKKDYSLQIKSCIIGIVIFFAFVIISIITDPYFSEVAEESLHDLINSSSGQEMIFCSSFLSGWIPTIIILFFKNHNDLSDPEENRYDSSYSSSSHYESTIESNGTIVTKKVNTTDCSSTDNWKQPGCIVTLVKMYISFFIGFAFVIWCVPYIIYAFIASRRKGEKIPYSLQNAYDEACEQYVKVPITRNNKIEFLMYRENHQNKKKQKNAFVREYTSDNNKNSKLPFRFIKARKMSYMIVDYRKQHYYHYGIAFVLVKNSEGNIEKKMVTNGSYVISNQDTWKQDWLSAGARQETIDNIEYYENQLNKFTR